MTAREEDSNASTTSETSEAEESSQGGGLTEFAISESFSLRMRPCPQPVWERAACNCCGRNMRLATELLAKFRDFVSTTSHDALQAGGPEFSEGERAILLTDSFLRRLLARCAGNFKESLERLMIARTVHRKYALDTSLHCRVCADKPGFHSFRQVGFDKLGRPVLYTCLNQDQKTGTSLEQVRDYFLHLIFVVREAEKTIPADQHTLVMVFDTTGLGMNHVRTDTVSQFGEMLKYFPSRMCYALLLNMSSLTRVILKPVIHLTGHKDDVLIVSRRDMERQLGECFGPELVRWMLAEMERNKQPKAPFCSAPANPGDHDPRGEPSYVRNYVTQRHPSGHRPHPSIRP